MFVGRREGLQERRKTMVVGLDPAVTRALEILIELQLVRTSQEKLTRFSSLGMHDVKTLLNESTPGADGPYQRTGTNLCWKPLKSWGKWDSESWKDGRLGYSVGKNQLSGQERMCRFGADAVGRPDKKLC